jgi:hypothetical protein
MFPPNASEKAKGLAAAVLVLVTLAPEIVLTTILGLGGDITVAMLLFVPLQVLCALFWIAELITPLTQGIDNVLAPESERQHSLPAAKVVSE